jgi:hypothetical protein
MQLNPMFVAMRYACHKPIVKGLVMGGLVTLLLGCGEEEQTTSTGAQIQSTSVLSFANSGVTRVTEGKVGESKTALVTLRLNRGHSEAIELDYETVDVSASKGTDFQYATGKLTIPKGEREAKISFTVFGDNRYETDESFEVKFTPSAGAANLTFDNKIARVEIANDDAMPLVQFKSPKLSVAENVGKVELTLGLDRDSDLQTKVAIEYKGLANNGTDYLTDVSEIVFEPGQISKILLLDIIKDDIIEGGEQIIINLLSPVNSTIGENKSGFVLILGDLALPDTGVVKAYAEGNFNSDSADQLHPYQDNLYGLDSHVSGTDDGYAGMVYTKIDRAGNALPRSASSELCVFDANTGLTWEKKDEPVDIPNLPYNETNQPVLEPVMAQWRSESYRYYWRTRDTANTGGSAGASAPKMFDPYGGAQYPYAPQACAFPSFNSEAYVRPAHGCTTDLYVELAQNTALCGFKSWRVPSINELMRLVIYEESLTTLDAFYFNDIVNQQSKLYLSDTPSAENDGSVWCLNVAEKRAQLCKKNNLHHVRLVRGNKL